MTEHTAITGNASTAVKDAVRDVLPKTWRRGGAGFGDAIGARLVITEVHILHADGARPRKTARVIVECTVQEDMLNLIGIMHGGCVAYLIGCCSLLPSAALELEKTEKVTLGVSQSANIVFHAPAVSGMQLRIISETLTSGARTSTTACQVWDVANNRLVASSVHADLKGVEDAATAKL